MATVVWVCVLMCCFQLGWLTTHTILKENIRKQKDTVWDWKCINCLSESWWTPTLIPPSCSLAGGWAACQARLTSRQMPALYPIPQSCRKPNKEIVNECRGCKLPQTGTHTNKLCGVFESDSQPPPTNTHTQ